MINAYQMAKTIDADYQGDASVMFQGVERDSRHVKTSQLFVAIKGEQVDGHDYLQSALENGASCALVETFQPVNISQIKVENTIDALGLIAKAYRDTLSIPVIGVTGSNGKTSMKEMIASLLASCCDDELAVYKTQGNLNNHIGLPMSVLNISNQQQYAVLEMGMSALGEIRYLSQIAKPGIAIITNAMPAHLLGLKTIEHIVEAKGEIFESLNEDGIAVINANSEGYQYWQEKLLDQGQTIIRYQLVDETDMSQVSNVDVKGYVASVTEQGQQLVIEVENKTYECLLPMIGRHNADNLLGALAVAHYLNHSNHNHSMEALIQGVASLKMVAGRSRLITGCNHAKVIDDSYNANPGSVKAACLTLAAINVSKKILVLGNMAELGDDENHWHNVIGQFAKESGITSLLCVGDLTQYACEGFGKNSKHYDSKAALIDDLMKELDEDCAVLVKGSFSMAMGDIVTAIVNNKEDGSH